MWRGPTSYSPTSPDITPLHLFLRVNIKSWVFGVSGHVGSVQTLTRGITPATVIITPEIFHIWAKTKCHLDLCCITGDIYSGPFSIHDSTICNSCYPLTSWKILPFFLMYAFFYILHFILFFSLIHYYCNHSFVFLYSEYKKIWPKLTESPRLSATVVVYTFNK